VSGWPEWLFGLYFLISAIFLAVLLHWIIYIRKITRLYPKKRLEGILVSFSTETGTPFSFLKMIFWNSQINLNSPTGKQIFRHESFHVQQKHSLDILFLEFIRGIFWFNPFFHLICREIRATHEFLADRFAISKADKYEYAELLVRHAIGIPSPSLVHSFFNTNLKRRINMLTQLNNTRPRYISRIMVLPVIFLLFCAFATERKKQEPGINQPSVKMITVVIDAGHGGFDAGAISSQGVNEKDIALSVAKKIKQFSSSYHINVLMTREEDIMPGNKTSIQDGLHYRTQFANEQKADLFISIHMNAGSLSASNGTEIYVSAQNPYFQKSLSLGSAMLEEINKTYPTTDQLKQRTEGIWVLKASAMPAILVLCGNLDDGKDLSFISNESNQVLFAKSILQGILKYEQNPANK